MRYLKALESSLNPDIKVIFDTEFKEEEFLKSKDKQKFLDTYYLNQ